MTIGVGGVLPQATQAQIVWEAIDSPVIALPPVIWEPVSDADEKDPSMTAVSWQVVPGSEEQDQPSTVVAWELLDAEEVTNLPTSETASTTEINPPASVEEAEALLSTIPLKPSDYVPLLRLSPSVPTAKTLPADQWRITFGNISPFESASGTGNQNYSINLDVGLNDSLMLSFFISQADDPLNAPLTGFAIQPANFWQSYGAAAQWQVLNQNNWKLAISGSLEAWEVGSGGDDSFSDSGDNASPNIFNDSGSRVFTRNFVGSLSLPATWQASEQWQFSFAPGVSLLPATQGSGQGGAGTFYGTNPYVSGGVLFQPFPELGFTASIAQPIGSGTNSFDADLVFSRVPILSAGINWDLNPRIGLKGLITNGFGATPATALLALPSDNRLGYSASFVFTPGTADTPQAPLTPRQDSLAKGGLTVNTALVPPDTKTEAWINADSGGNVNGFVGYSLSNIFQLTLFSGGLYNNVPQTTPQARLYANDGAWNWRIGGKAVAFSPLRGAPFWGGGRITLGRSNQESSTGQGYVFAETMATWEATEGLAINFNPKVALSGAGNLWGLGISSNLQLFPGWELVPEGNVVINQLSQSNGTLGLRWHATDSVALEAYGSTAASLLDIGQLINAEQVRWGGRLLIGF
ncbi:hypothetical protein [Synechococcus sp. MIT S9509]|uniref:hypothetical protein n=1 Tax=Synechococcus sp. MIT S9509 TaxID=1801630 RepID=UPI0012E859E6|nr:hypothetical protein [Synechococcus sp. MIT S9509]